MNNKNILITVTILALILIVGFFWWAQTNNQTADQTPNNNGMVDENVDENVNGNPEENNEEIEVADGSTIVAENGEFTPETITVFPGQEMKLMNNENSDLSLIFQDVEMGPFPAQGSGAFRAPMEAGSFEYTSSLNQNATFTLIVEI